MDKVLLTNVADSIVLFKWRSESGLDLVDQ